MRSHFGPIDIWINDAMATVFAKAVDTDPAEFKRATEVTYLGTVYGTMAALRRMTARDHGKIVQVGSALAYRAIPLQSAYCGSKFAIRGFTDSIRTELLHDKSKVRITMVQLPGVNTTQFNWCRSKLPKHPKPVPPIYQPEIPAEAVYWAAHHHRRELWVGYSAVQAILGNMIAPSLADRYLARTAFSGQQVRTCPSPPIDRTTCSLRAADGGDARHLRQRGQDVQPSAVGRHAPLGRGRSARLYRRRRGRDGVENALTMSRLLAGAISEMSQLHQNILKNGNPVGPRIPAPANEQARSARAARFPNSFHRGLGVAITEPAPTPKPRHQRRSAQALCRTRTDDPFLTMEVLYQLS